MTTPHATPRATTEGTVYTVTGGDWDEVVESAVKSDDERIIVNMGPQHPSTHGVLRLILEIDGETVTEARCGIGYLHTGIEKNLEFRNWTQGTTFVTRMDYLTPFFNETAYCLGVEKLLGIEDQIPDRATVIRVLLMELNRLSSHLVCIATGGMELGATTIMIYGFRDRELVLDLFELFTGLRMNHAFAAPAASPRTCPRARSTSCAVHPARRWQTALSGCQRRRVGAGTCKDIPRIFANPHSLVEGIVIACYAIRSSHAFIYLRGEVVPVLRRLHEAVREAYEAGYLGTNILGSGLDLELTVHAGAGCVHLW
ncbi:NAD(P)H-quinone oxidoreductase subunit H, chloroplastic [Streptomyces badius]